jgi:dienelactone hydrolase
MRSLSAFTALLVLGLTISEARAEVDLGLPTQPKANVQLPAGGGTIFGAQLYAPPDRGRHPAVVMSHTCAGISRHVFEWADRALASGYVVMIVDHLGPRQQKNNCPPDNPVSVTDYAQDDVVALRHLRTLPFVDGSRIGHMGWSYGAMAGLRLASANFRKRYVGGERFGAIVAMYPWCNERVGRGGDHQYNFYDDTDVPLFLVLGADDSESSPKSCIEQAGKNKSRGLPVEWKLYPSTTHGFDFSQLGDRPMTFRRPGSAETITYRYNAATVADAWALSLAFYSRSLAATR